MSDSLLEDFVGAALMERNQRQRSKGDSTCECEYISDHPSFVHPFVCLILLTLCQPASLVSYRPVISQELLKSLALDQKSEQEVSEIQSSINLSAVAVAAFNNLATWREMMPDFESSVMLLETIDKVLDLVPKNKESSSNASRLATEILSRPWPAHNVVKVHDGGCCRMWC